MIKKITNPELPKAELTRQTPGALYVEGEDFRARCPDWCYQIADAALPDQEGWYLVVNLIRTSEGPELECVWLEYQSWAQERLGDGWIVNRAGSESNDKRRDYYWIGKIRMPSISP